MSDADFRPKARLVRGFRDRSGGELAAERAMLETIRGVYERYGFAPLETPSFEYADALGKFLPDQDRPNEGVFALQDDDAQWLSLRYDLTAPLARYVAQAGDALPKPYRRYATGTVWRNEKPGPGRFREFVQFDADTVGSASMAADAEFCMLLADTLKALGLTGEFAIRVNNRKILNGVLDSAGIVDPRQRGATLRAIDKYDRLLHAGVRALLGESRTDESGDVTPGAGLSPQQIDKVLAFIEQPKLSSGSRLAPDDRPSDVEIGSYQRSTADGYWSRINNSSLLERLRSLFGENALVREGLDELEQIVQLTRAGGFGDGEICIEPSIVRGLGYYTGPIFEADLTFNVPGEDGRPVRFGSVGSGGRYDDLVERFTGQKAPATGASIGVSRLAAALAMKGLLKTEAPRGPVVVLVMDKDRLPGYQQMVRELRNGGIAAELYLGSAGMKAQLKYADRRNSPVAVIEGGDERAKGVVTLKDLALGAEMAKSIATSEEWKAARPAQMTVARADLVAAVRRILDARP